MNLEYKILELVKEKPMLMSEIEEKLGVSVAEVIDMGVLHFLRKYGLVEITPTNEGGLVKITPRGLQLLNLPDLPEGELPSDQLEVLEKHWGDEIDRTLDKEADLNLNEEDVRAEQATDEEAIEKDFEKQMKEANEEGEFSEATINSIKAREDKRQREIAEAPQ